MHETVIVGEAVAGESVKARRQLTSLIKHLNTSTFDIGTLLHNIKKNGWYDGYTTFQEYVETLEIKPRKAQYLRRIAEVMDTVGIPREKYEPVGIGKLRKIASLGGNPFDPTATWTKPDTDQTTPIVDFIIGFVEKGQQMTLQEIDEHVRVLKGLVGENDLVFETYCYTRSVQEQVVEPAKELARRNMGSVGKDEEGNSKDISSGACLEVWAVEYLNNPGNNVLPEEG